MAEQLNKKELVDKRAWLSGTCATIIDYFNNDSKIKDLYIFKRDPSNNFITIKESNKLVYDNKMYIVVNFNIDGVSNNPHFKNLYGPTEIVVKIEMIKVPNEENQYYYMVSTNWDSFYHADLFNSHNCKVSICNWFEKLIRIAVDAYTYWLIDKDEVNTKYDKTKFETLKVRESVKYLHYIMTEKYYNIITESLKRKICQYHYDKLPNIVFKKNSNFGSHNIINVGSFDTTIYGIRIWASNDDEYNGGLKLTSRPEDSANDQITIVDGDDNLLNLITNVVIYYLNYENKVTYEVFEDK